MHDEDGSELVGERVDRLIEPGAEIRWNGAHLRRQERRFVEIGGAKSDAFHFAHAIQGDRYRDRVEPCRERRIAAELLEPFESANKRVLREIRREIAVSRHAIDEAVDAIHMSVVQRALGVGVAGEATRDQFAICGGHVIRRSSKRSGDRHRPPREGWVSGPASCKRAGRPNWPPRSVHDRQDLPYGIFGTDVEYLVLMTSIRALAISLCASAAG